VLNGILSPEYDVKVAINGKMALKIAQKLTPDIILLDIMMPVMDGYETCVQLKADKRTASIPVIFVTALGAEDDESKGFEVGCVDYITKPFSVRELMTRIKVVFRRYTKEVIDRIIKADNETFYVIFLNDENYQDFNIEKDNVKKVIVNIKWYTLTEQILMPYYIWREKINLMHFPHFNVPLFVPCK
jgi:DNA-binding response OmpR family regulator